MAGGRRVRHQLVAGGRRAAAEGGAVIKIVVADDHPMVRDGLRTLFESFSDTELVSEAGTGREAVRPR